jgi:hypothetical protein
MNKVKLKFSALATPLTSAGEMRHDLQCG